MERSQRLSALVLLAVVCAVGFGSDVIRQKAMAHYVATQEYEDMYYVPPPAWLPVMSLGYDEALADLLWCRALVYFGNELQHRGDVEHIFTYADAIISLDKQFKRVYQWAGVAGIYRPKGVGVLEIKRAAKYLEEAAALFPDDGHIAWDAGATLQFELLPYIHDAEEKKALKARALGYMETAARMGAGPAWLVLSNATELRELGRSEQALRHLEEMYATVQDRDTKAEILRQIQAVRSAGYAEAMTRTVAELDARRAAQYPYLSTTLYLLVGPRPLVDERAMIANGFAPADVVPASAAGDDPAGATDQP